MAARFSHSSECLKRGPQIAVRLGVVRVETKRLVKLIDRFRDTANLKVLGGEERVPGWIARLGPDSHFRASDVGTLFALNVVSRQNRCGVVVARQDLEPEDRHLVRRVRAVSDALRRMMRVARIVRRIIVGEAHRERRPFGQELRHAIAVLILPFEVPRLDPDQRFHRAVGEGRRAL